MNDLEPMGRDSIVRYVKELLPIPIWEEEGLDGSMTLVGGDPGEVIVRITADEVSVSVFSVRWEGPHTPRVFPQRLASLCWCHIPTPSLMMSLHTLVDAASEVRRESYSLYE